MKKKSLNLKAAIARKPNTDEGQPSYAQVFSTNKLSKVGRPKSDDPRVSFGVGLKRSEVERIKTEAKKRKVSTNGLTAYLIRYSLKQLEDNKLQIELEEGNKQIAN